MTASRDIKREVSGTKGRYALTTAEGEGDVTYSNTSPSLVIDDHTAVAPGLEGQGVGRRLLDRLLEDARTEGFKIVPLCPYVNAQRRKHSEWADLFNV